MMDIAVCSISRHCARVLGRVRFRTTSSSVLRMPRCGRFSATRMQEGLCAVALLKLKLMPKVCLGDARLKCRQYLPCSAPSKGVGKEHLSNVTRSCPSKLMPQSIALMVLIDWSLEHSLKALLPPRAMTMPAVPEGPHRLPTEDWLDCRLDRRLDPRLDPWLDARLDALLDAQLEAAEPFEHVDLWKPPSWTTIPVNASPGLSRVGFAARSGLLPGATSCPGPARAPAPAALPSA
mmetsp:Transcript_17954/g.55550  ORF Transcript_17954/g.55550 Transcript_17954/m.55550 type:complete len:235 (-) Transcript_17954:2-706(-)